MENKELKNKNNTREQKILDYINSKDYSKITVKQLAVIFGTPKEDMPILEKIILGFQKQGIIYIDTSKRICKCLPTMYVGVFENKSYSFGVVHTENEDVYIPRIYTMGAMDKDLVLVNKEVEKSGIKNAEGKVLNILTRANMPIVGTLILDKSFGFVAPVNSAIEDIYIPKKYIKNVKNDSRVVIKIEKYATESRKAEGKIIEVLGCEDDTNIERDTLIKASMVDSVFSKAVIDEAENISKEKVKITSDRRDLTGSNIYTIDSDDTKDMDDAVAIKLNCDGTYVLSVHIADVSHYVTENSALDKTAILRGTSIYMPDFVIPMLPKSLSNGICSLNEGENRYTLSIDMLIDKTGKVLNSDIYKAVICSKKKMTYSSVEKVLAGENIAGYEKYVEDLNLMKELSLILKNKRKNEGSIDLDVPETKIILDEEGNVLSIGEYIAGIANNIIEEFMLVANKCIAMTFNMLNAPFIYRIHEVPELESLRSLNEELKTLNLAIKGINNIHPKALADVIDKYKRQCEENTDENVQNNKMLISKLILRSLKVAKYSEECLGHFGLNFKYYTHFTSPIRRYPDLFIHRVISEYIASNYSMDEKRLDGLYKKAARYAKTSSEAERRATMLERDVCDMYMAKYMKDKIGKTYIGVISGVCNYGMYVKLENTVEGLVAMKNIPGDYYIYDEKKSILLGTETGKVYHIGDNVRVKVISADEKLRHIDFRIF